MKSIILSAMLLLGSISYGQNSLCTVSDQTIDRIEYYRTAIPYIKYDYVIASIQNTIQEDACLDKHLKPEVQSSLTTDIYQSKAATIKSLVVSYLEKAQAQK